MSCMQLSWYCADNQNFNSLIWQTKLPGSLQSAATHLKSLLPLALYWAQSKPAWGSPGHQLEWVSDFPANWVTNERVTFNDMWHVYTDTWHVYTERHKFNAMSIKRIAVKLWEETSVPRCHFWLPLPDSSNTKCDKPVRNIKLNYTKRAKYILCIISRWKLFI